MIIPKRRKIKLKFLLFNLYGAPAPDVLKPYLDAKPYPQNRYGEIIEFVEKNVVSILGLTTNPINYLYNNTTAILYFPEKDTSSKRYLAFCSKAKGCVSFRIEELDLGKNYVLHKYQEREHLEEMNYKLIDSEIHLYAKEEQV